VPARGRRPLGSPDARGAVLDAARELFAELGFERTTMRAVGARAGVDPALIYHYFGDKDRLLSAVIEVPADLAAALAGVAGDSGRAGEQLVRRVITVLEGHPEIRGRMLAMLRTALSHDHAAQLLRDRLSSLLLAAFGDVLAGDRRELRTALIASQMGGLMLARYIVKVPGAAAASREDLVQAVGPVIQHYLTGTIAPAPNTPRPPPEVPRGTSPVAHTQPAGDH
jgi:AcrR family transcriptional regulator